MNISDPRLKYIKKSIRAIPDFPKKGIIFRDITTLLQDKAAMQLSIQFMKESLTSPFASRAIYNKFLGVESRGFIFAGALSAIMGGGVILARKPGKLPYQTTSVEYDLEYGKETLSIHNDAVKPLEQVIIVDDLLATGGTALAAAHLVEFLGGVVERIIFLVELPELKGREKLIKYKVTSIITFDGH